MFRIFVLYTLIMLSINMLGIHPGTLPYQYQHNMKTFNISHQGQRVEARPDDTLRIVLPTQMGTGYRWHWEEQAAFRLIEEKVEPKDNIPGASEEQVFIIRPLKKGKHQLSLAYRRSWETQILKYYELQIKVAE